MLHHCDLCPEQTMVHNFLKEQLLLNYIVTYGLSKSGSQFFKGTIVAI